MTEPKRTTIKLERPIFDESNAVIDEIVLRDPNYDDYMTFDEPWTFQFTEGGQAVPIDHGPTIALYVGRCLVKPKLSSLLTQCTVRDGMAIKRWLTRFFTDGAVATQESTTSSTSSSTATGA